MEILVHTDSKVTLSPNLDAHIRRVLDQRLARFGHRLTRVDVGFNEENARGVGVPDRRCTIEARPAGLDPVAVKADAAEALPAFDGAVEKLLRVLETRLSREGDHKGAASIRKPPPG